MKWISRHRPSPAFAVAIAAVIVAVGGVAFATIPDSNGTIHACYQKNSGSLRVVESGGCRPNETPLNWNQQGPPGGSGDMTAYAYIQTNGTLDPSRTKNVGMVESDQSGGFCFGLSFEPKNVQGFGAQLEGPTGREPSGEALHTMNPIWTAEHCPEAYRSIAVAGQPPFQVLFIG
jgi:hypothetical protein